MEGVAEQGEARLSAEARFELGDAGWMPNGVLGKAVGPTADYCKGCGRRGCGRRTGDGGAGVEDARKFEAGDGGDLVVVAAGDAIGRGAAEEGADEAAVGRDAIREFLIDEGAGEKKAHG